MTLPTAKQLQFVDHYIRNRNASAAYRHAYETSGMKPQSIASRASELLADGKITSLIEERSVSIAEKTGASALWLAQRLLDIATADPRELIGLRIGCCRYCHGEGHGYQWREREYMEALAEAERNAAAAEGNRQLMAQVRYPDVGGGFGFDATRPPADDCPECHGEGRERLVARDTDELSDQALLLYGGAKMTKDGLQVIIADRVKALELYGKVIGAFTDNLRIDAKVRALHAVGDLRDADPQAAAAAYRDFVAGALPAS